MKIVIQIPKPRSDAARALAGRRYRHRLVRDKKTYSRKGRASSTRKFEDSIQRAIFRALIESPLFNRLQKRERGVIAHGVGDVRAQCFGIGIFVMFLCVFDFVFDVF
jgi:hypothetical protein